MKIKTSELTGLALDWVVAKCDGHNLELFDVGEPTLRWVGEHMPARQYSTQWSAGGPIIERERISVLNPHGHHLGGGWCAGRMSNNYQQTGPTPLIAAMRCYVASKLGDEVAVPNELCE